MNSKEKTNNQLLVVYMPVIHEGYRQFFARFPQVTEVWLIGEKLAHELRPLQKDVRALPAKEAQKLLQAWKRFTTIKILTPQNLEELQQFQGELVFANDDISRHLTRKYFPDNRVIFDTFFLMWDSESATKKNDVKKYSKITNKKFAQKMMQLAGDESTRSDDWWRHIGALIIKDGQVVLQGHNQHVPAEYEAYYEGDPRGNFHKGEYYKLSTAIHVEAYLIAQAAQQGISLEGTELYVTTFPCPVCAKQIAYSGIKNVYFSDGYSVLDGEKVLTANDVELIKVE